MAERTIAYHDIFPPKCFVTGIRQDTGASRPVVITGSYPGASGPQEALLYRGPLYPSDPSGYFYLTPAFSGQTVTSSVFYGPNTPLYDPAIGAGNVRAVGSYKYEAGGAFDHGMMYEGPYQGGGAWTALDVPDHVAGGTVANTLAHSTMGDLVVGNYDLSGKPASGNAFIYNIRTKRFTVLEIGKLATAYGIWRDAGPRYVICGGYDAGAGLNRGFLLDYDAETGAFSNLTGYSYDNRPSLLTHFEGITGIPGGYALAAQSGGGAAFAEIPRNPDGTFGAAKWLAIRPSETGICTGNSVYLYNVIGIYQAQGGGVQSYVASVT